MAAASSALAPTCSCYLPATRPRSLITELKSQFDSRPCGPLLSEHVLETLANSVAALREAGAEFVTGGQAGKGPGFCFQNTLLRVSGSQFLKSAERLQTEAFGNATLVVVVDGLEQAKAVAARMEGSLTASLYSSADGSDDSLYDALAPILRRRAGRLLNDKMPTGVAVSPAMNHGGPFPATGHPGFTAVGIPASLRFRHVGMLRRRASSAAACLATRPAACVTRCRLSCWRVWRCPSAR